MLKWPERERVLEATRAWALEVAHRVPETVRIVLFGSYARGVEGVGSDLDLHIEVSEYEQPLVRRPAPVTSARLPLPADIIIHTSGELAQMRAEGRRFIDELDAGLQLWPCA